MCKQLLTWPLAGLAFLVGAAIFFFQPVLANQPDFFETVLHSTYYFSQEAPTRVQHQIVIRNLTPVRYIEEYAFQISQADIEDPVVTVNDKPISPQIISTPEHTTFSLNLGNAVVGTDKEQSLEISYLDPALSLPNSTSGRIIIPNALNRSDIDRYQVTVVTPSEIGLPTKTYPDVSTTTQQGNSIISFFDEIQSGVVVQFGESTNIAFDLSYQLPNQTNSITVLQIPLPPDTVFQRISFSELSPQPNSIKRDPDGNWIASYEVQPQSLTEVKVSGIASVSAKGNPEIFPLPHEQDTQLSQVWTSEKISPEKQNDLESVLNTVIQSDYSLHDDTSLWQQITDSSVGYLRAHGFPTRRASGLNLDHQPDSSIYHWALTHTGETWQLLDLISIQETSQASSGLVPDLNRLVIVLNSHQTDQPNLDFLALKTGTHSAQLETTEDAFPPSQPVSFTVHPRRIFGLRVPGHYQLEVQSAHDQAHYQLALSSKPQPGIQLEIETETLSILLPGQSAVIPLTVVNQSLSHFTETQVELVVDGQAKIYQLTSAPKVITSVIKHTPITMGFILAGFAFITGGILVHRRHR